MHTHTYFFNQNTGNRYGNRLLYASIALNTTLNPAILGYEKGLVVHDYWEEFVKKEVRFSSFES